MMKRAKALRELANIRQSLLKLGIYYSGTEFYGPLGKANKAIDDLEENIELAEDETSRLRKTTN